MMFNKALPKYDFIVIYNHRACSGIKKKLKAAESDLSWVSDKQVGVIAVDILVLSCHLMIKEQITANYQPLLFR